MVRLKDAAVNGQTLIAGFQFQNGSIKRTYHFPCPIASTLFQFQNGSIKSKTKDTGARVEIKFQFQNGSIKRSRARPVISIEMSFNSKMVRLKGTL